jgi:MoxR-like ATPase
VLEHYGTIGSAEEGPARTSVETTIGPEAIAAARACADRIHVSTEIRDYILALARASREHAQIALGLSTRGAIALMRTARVAAGLRGADFVTPDDVKRVTPWVMPHRLALTPEALLEAVQGRDLAAMLLERVPVPR